MATLSRFFRRLTSLLRSGRTDAELSREIAAHLALLEDEYRRRGMSPAEAHRAARAALGGVERTRELHREARSFLWIEDARRDAFYALRLLRRSPVVALTVVLSLAIGIGANTAIFTVANALLFTPPPGIAGADRLVDIGLARDDGGLNPSSYPAYLELRRRSTLLDAVFGAQMFPQPVGLAVGDADASERIFARFVTITYFAALRTPSAAGRLFGLADSEQPGASPVAVLSHRFWMRRFGGDPSIVGRAIRINGRPLTVIGVTAERFRGTGAAAADVWLPLDMLPDLSGKRAAMLAEPAGAWLVIGGRLKEGVELPAAAAEVDAIGSDFYRSVDASRPQARTLRLVPSSAFPGNRRVLEVFFGLLMGIVALVMLVACANVSGVLLARAAARQREIAVRLAIGAGRGRLVRQLLMEAAVLFALGGAAGFVLARAATSLVVASLPALPFPLEVSLDLDLRVIAFTLALASIAALVSGLAPALQASRPEQSSALKAEGFGARRGSRLRHAFVVAQVVFTMVLVVTAGLFVRALAQAGAVSPGFDADGVELATIDRAMADSDARPMRPQTWTELLAQARALPGVESAALAAEYPGGFEVMGLGLSLPAADPPSPDDFEPDGNIVEPGYFAAMRIRLVAGRDFTDADRAGSEPVVIVGEAAARHFWPGQDAVGKYLSQPTPRGPKLLRVIGVARDVRATSLIDGASQSTVYLPLQQQDPVPGRMIVALRTRLGQRTIDALRKVVASIDPNLSIASAQSMKDRISLGLTLQRVAASISGTLGSVGLLLAAMGIYGVTAFAVTRRMREFGVRIALGARRADLVRMVLREGLLLSAIGCAVGLAMGAGIARVLKGFLYAFAAPPIDPVVFGGAAVLFAAIALAACYGPARRATTADPLAALRHE